jgi:hypothetical protein
MKEIIIVLTCDHGLSLTFSFFLHPTFTTQNKNPKPNAMVQETCDFDQHLFFAFQREVRFHEDLP